MTELICPQSPHGFAANTYIITSDGDSAVIDPTVEYSSIYSKLSFRYIILTHCHFDHILEIDSWVKATGATVIISSQDGKAVSDPGINCYRLFEGSEKGYFGDYLAIGDNDNLPFGNGSLRFLILPGHTAGSMAILTDDDKAFVGDTVFAGGGLGRWDLPTGNFANLKNSILRVMDLPEHTILFCGHGKPTTVKKYKEDKIQRIF